MKYRVQENKKNPSGDMDDCVVCGQVEVSAMDRSIVERCPIDCGVSLCVI